MKDELLVASCLVASFKKTHMSRNNFQKFIKKEDKGARLKEKIRQEKKKTRQETKEFFAKKKLESRGSYTAPLDNQASQNPTERKPGTSRPKSSFKKPSALAPSYSSKKRIPVALVVKKSGRTTTEHTTNEKANAKKIPAQPDPKVKEEVKDPGEMPLNKFVSHGGICSRRDAVDLVKSGKVSVNGRVITEPGFKVTRRDEIKVQGKKITPARNLVYILLNKPKDHITTTDDPQGRKTVMDIVKNATTERVFPIGRLDRNTTGVLLLTNDGDLAQKLSHPSYEVRKIYEVTLDKPLVKKDFEELLNGITLEDGFVAPDSLAYADARNKSIVGIEIHSGKNRIVRRMFEKLGYDVRNLDRVMYANLTKKNVERGKWRYLQEKEIRLLKFMNASYGKKKSEAQ